ncbi:MAG: bifunctional adenosylcobinamide kinase/adenosylcobinamide-phosphate guanylyltransferase [Clostridiales bacterium]|jgi:adenosylcobinamide kinase/adenosylcobinamide-phosphate guanylyltransferase|nr:bifunctional adenosylcobinamide kinase/adenosylcobinamide-phosphate guanylyltransferase [Clostridiales bacterium]
MLVLVTGGASCGKSEYAEKLIADSDIRPRIYIATMEAYDEESRLRVEKHRKARAGKEFETIECPCGLADVEVQKGSAVLLECLSNLTANECFGGEGMQGAGERILAGVDRLMGSCSLLVVVTNELFSDGRPYDGDLTRDYLLTLAGINRKLAARADRVYELVCGIPVIWKGAPK